MRKFWVDGQNQSDFSVKSAEKFLKRNFIDEYLKGAVVVTDKKLSSMFGAFVAENELLKSLIDLAKSKKISIENRKKDKLIVSKG